MKLRLLSLGASLLALSSCQRDPGPPAKAQTLSPAAAPAASAPASGASAAPAPAPAGGGISGRVVETMNSGGYTYARVERDGASVWVAGPETPLTVGMELSGLDGMVMTGFTSDTLKRTFDKITFVNAYNTGGAAPAPGAAAGAGTQATVASAHSGVASGDMPVDKVEPAKGGKTVEQIFAGKAELTGKPVVVRGKIVKLNGGILGRNWLHLRDGTGAAGSNDLLVTTQATPNLGDVVVVRGTVATNKDFGAGYRYDVLVEDATVGAQ